jgi:hypothetical protein
MFLDNADPLLVAVCAFAAVPFVALLVILVPRVRRRFGLEWRLALLQEDLDRFPCRFPAGRCLPTHGVLCSWETGIVIAYERLFRDRMKVRIRRRFRWWSIEATLINKVPQEVRMGRHAIPLAELNGERRYLWPLIFTHFWPTLYQRFGRAPYSPQPHHRPVTLRTGNVQRVVVPLRSKTAS